MFIYVLNLKTIKRFLGTTFTIICALAFAHVIGYIILGHLSSDQYLKVDAQANNIIIIDAGHGGEDPGAIGISGIYEKDINLQIALMLGEELKSRNYTVIYTRTTDKMLYLPEENIKGMRKISDLKNRCKLTEGYDNAILISIHMNSYAASQYSGLQVYYKDGDDESREFASKIQNTVKKSLQPSNTRQVKNGNNIYLLENTNCTSVLIECGFISNESECKKLSEKEYQKQLCFSIICGIIEYMEEKGGLS